MSSLVLLFKLRQDVVVRVTGRPLREDNRHGGYFLSGNHFCSRSDVSDHPVFVNRVTTDGFSFAGELLLPDLELDLNK